MPRPVHFEIHAADLDRLQAFYEAVLGWSFRPVAPDYRAIVTGEGGRGIDGALLQRRGPAVVDGAAVNAWMCTVDVDDVDAYLQRALEAGGALALPKMAIPGVGYLAYAKDPDGNIFGMLQAAS
jgi:predicted enzyme related to lactoylglutathione lyase